MTIAATTRLSVVEEMKQPTATNAHASSRKPTYAVTISPAGKSPKNDSATG